MNNQFMAVMYRRAVGGWSQSARVDNALATAIRAAEPGRTHIITGIAAGYTNVRTGRLRIFNGAAVIFDQLVVNAFSMSFEGLAATAGNAVSAEIEASGTAGQFGSVNLLGFTI